MRQFGSWGRCRAPHREGAVGDPDAAFAPALGVALKLMDRQGVKELVGHKPQRALAKVIDGAAPGDVPARQGFGLLHLQDRRGLHQCHLCGGMKAGHCAGCTQDIGHERAAPGAQFGKNEAVGRPLIQPALRKAEPDQLAKHLADFGGGDKVALGPQWIAGGVVAFGGVQQRFGHVGGQWNGSALRDADDQLVTQAHAAGAAARRARRINHSPIRIIGSDRICPIVSPYPPTCHASPSGLPGPMNCASGWRTNSTAKRARP
mmetsp:Transcript_23464/g.41242  ORF Transcript_23464/g.41242 Transcript_23464/m.41242 type:complete len:261 (+) Transcript_23464:1432-2214(+)